jgi:hypothetical protein
MEDNEKEIKEEEITEPIEPEVEMPDLSVEPEVPVEV